MNNFLDNITKCDLKIFYFLLFLTAGIGDYINHWIFAVSVIMIAVAISTIRYQHDRKWLKLADKYIRIKMRKSFWQNVLSIVKSLLVGLLYCITVSELGDQIKPHTITLLTLFGSALALSISDYYHKFVNSIKSFDDGIQFPGRHSELIPWKELYTFTIHEKVHISSSKGENEFEIDPDDIGFTYEMISDWKDKNGRRTLRST